MSVPDGLAKVLNQSLALRPAAPDALAGACLAHARWFGKQAPAAWIESLDRAEVSSEITDEQLAFRLDAHFQVSAKTWDAWMRKLLPIAWRRTQQAIAPSEQAEAHHMDTLALAALCFEAPYRLARATVQ